MNRKVVEKLERLLAIARLEKQRLMDYGNRMLRKGGVRAYETAIKLLQEDTTDLLDITSPECVEIIIKSDGKVVWINTENGCQFRACQIKVLEVKDERK